MNNISNQLNINNLLKTKWGKQFNKQQLKQIELGLEQNLDVTSYANPKYNPVQMNEIRRGLENKLDISFYNNPKYEWQQMYEIRLGLERGLDVSVYANLKYKWKQMYEIRYFKVYKYIRKSNYSHFRLIAKSLKPRLALYCPSTFHNVLIRLFYKSLFFTIK